ncbi:MAG TPA: ABC transporter permease [Spirochaetia bacterium]|nr:ABC transporter permease [Spirochaetia bacterium]
MTPRSHGPLFYAFERFRDNKAAVGAGIVLGIIVLSAIFAPLLTPTGPNEQAYLVRILGFPSAQNWFGVDAVGRDLYSRIVFGARVSVGVGTVSALVSLVIGVPLGALAGYRGGKADWVVMRFVEIFSVIPPLLVALLVAALVGGGVVNVVLIASAFGWVQVCRLVRGQVMAQRQQTFVVAARAMGASPWYLIRRHLIPNSISPIIIGFVLAIPQAMMLEAMLSFLGAGIRPPIPSWGQMISDGLYYMFHYWHLAVFPTLALAVTVLSTSVFGDGLRDALDPTLKGR